MSIDAVLMGKTLPTKDLCQALMEEVKNLHCYFHLPLLSS